MSYLIGIDTGTTHTKAVAFSLDGNVLASREVGYPVIADRPGYHELDPDVVVGAVLECLQAVLTETGEKGETGGKGGAADKEKTGRKGEAGEKAATGAAGTAVMRSEAVGDGGGRGLVGISFSSAMHSLIAVDNEGKPLTRIITWADLRSTKQAALLKADAAGERIYRHTGTPIHPMSPLCKLIWLREEAPDIFQRAARFVSIKEYIWWKFTGTWRIDHSIASATGLFDIYRREWYEESLKIAGITAAQLSEPVPCTYSDSSILSLGKKSPSSGESGLPSIGESNLLSINGPGLPIVGESVLSAMEKFGLPAGIRLIIGGSDGCMANLGSLAVLPGETALTIGTSGAIRMTTDRPVSDPQARIFNYILTDRLYIAGGATNNGGGVMQWFLEQFPKQLPSPLSAQLPAQFPEQFLSQSAEREGRASGPMDAGKMIAHMDTSILIAEADSVPAGCDGLIFLPYLHGERAPIWNADARGVFFGIRSDHTWAHFLRAVMEGICYALFSIGVSLEETAGEISHIYASGGFIKSKNWVQMMADVFDRKVYVTNAADASAIGAVITGFYSLGMIDGPEAVKNMVHVRERYEPDKKNKEVYRKNLAIFTALYERLKDLMGPGESL